MHIDPGRVDPASMDVAIAEAATLGRDLLHLANAGGLVHIKSS